MPRAKYPVIDIHSHHFDLSAERWATVVREMDGLNLRLLVNLSGGTGDELRRKIAVVANSPAPTRMVQFANLDFDDLNQLGYGPRAAARLEADVKAGARGLKIYKNLGMTLKRSDGRRVPVDDPEFDPVWDMCARLHIPVLIHTARTGTVLRSRRLEERALAGAAGPPGATPSALDRSRRSKN